MFIPQKFIYQKVPKGLTRANQKTSVLLSNCEYRNVVIDVIDVTNESQTPLLLLRLKLSLIIAVTKDLSVWKHKQMRCLKRMREHRVWADNKDNVLFITTAMDKNNHRLCEDGLSHRDVTAETAVSKPGVSP